MTADNYVIINDLRGLILKAERAAELDPVFKEKLDNLKLLNDNAFENANEQLERW